MRRPYDRRAGEKKEKERAGFTPDVTGRRGKLFEPRHTSRLTSSSQCERRPPSNAASGKSAETGHDAQRTPYRYRKIGRRHSLRPPPAESPAHFDSITRRRRAHLHLGSLGSTLPSQGQIRVARCISPRGGFTSTLGFSVPRPHLLVCGERRERTHKQRQQHSGRSEPTNGAGRSSPGNQPTGNADGKEDGANPSYMAMGNKGRR